MSEGTVVATFIIVFRETLEAGLIVGIILTMLSRLKAMRYSLYVWMSTAFAIGVSVLVGLGLKLTASATQGRWEKIIEGGVSLAACAVLTHMIFWMDRQARRIRPEIEERIENAVTRQELPAIILLPFFAVFREGVETVLFLMAVAIQSSGPVSLAGGLLGFALAGGVTALIFVGGRKIPLKTLFRSTGVFLLVIAAGMLAYGIHELQELGWIPMLVYPVWDINSILNEKEGFGSFLKALFGYNGNPSLIEVVAYVGYLAVVMSVLRRRGRTTETLPTRPRAPISPDVTQDSPLPQPKVEGPQEISVPTPIRQRSHEDKH